MPHTFGFCATCAYYILLLPISLWRALHYFAILLAASEMFFGLLFYVLNLGGFVMRKFFLFLTTIFMVNMAVFSVSAMDGIAVHLGVFSESKGTSGDLAPHFSSDPAVGGSLAVGWREYEIGIEVAQFAGLRSMLGTSGHTTLFASTQQNAGKYNVDVQYQYIHMRSILPSWLPWIDDNCHEILVTTEIPHIAESSQWRPYALAGLAATDGSLLGTLTIAGGVGVVRTFPISRRIDFAVDSFAAAYLVSLGGDRKVLGKASGSFLFSFETLPLSLEAGLHAFKALGDKGKTWTEFSAQYCF